LPSEGGKKENVEAGRDWDMPQLLPFTPGLKKPGFFLKKKPDPVGFLGFGVLLGFWTSRKK